MTVGAAGSEYLKRFIDPDYESEEEIARRELKEKALNRLEGILDNPKASPSEHIKAAATIANLLKT